MSKDNYTTTNYFQLCRRNFIGSSLISDKPWSRQLYSIQSICADHSHHLFTILGSAVTVS